MRLIVTADLHYNIARSRGPTEALARRIVRGGGDALLLLGDVAGAEKDALQQCLRLFEGFGGARFFVPGNHCLWSRNGVDALHLLRHELPAMVAEAGFTCLEHAPAVLGDVGLAGTVGWYDYSLRDRALDLPMRFYERKVAPGAARYFRQHHDLLADTADLDDAHLELTARWMDGVHVTLPMSDAAFTQLLAGKLAAQLDELGPKVGRIVVGIHHVPFANMMPTFPPGANWQFVAAYMGSERFGQVCLAQPKVSHVLCGHTHQPLRRRNGPIQCINVGSNYHAKRMVKLDL